MIRIGVIGFGSQADEYIKHLCSLESYQFAGIYHEDNLNYNQKVSPELIYRVFDEFIRQVDAVLLLHTKEDYVEIAKKCIRAGKHLILDKTLAFALEQYEEIINIADEANVKCMIAMTDRFNPAYQSLKTMAGNPLFIEVVRTFQKEKTTYQSSVVNQLMKQDIDLILHIVKSEIKRISATGIKIVSETSDIANARLEFANGCVVNLTASRIAMKNSHKMKLFEPESYYRVDLLQNNVEKIYFESNSTIAQPLNDNFAEQKEKNITSENIQVVDNDSVRLALAHFATCIENNNIPLISPHESYIVLDTVQKIIKKINSFTEE